MILSFFVYVMSNSLRVQRSSTYVHSLTFSFSFVFLFYSRAVPQGSVYIKTTDVRVKENIRKLKNNGKKPRVFVYFYFYVGSFKQTIKLKYFFFFERTLTLQKNPGH